MAFRNRPSDSVASGAVWLVVGLGNPGAEYSGTRHNIGADAVDACAVAHGVRLKAGKERALSGEYRHEGSTVVLAKPTTFMNLSGESVRPLAKRHGVTDPSRIVVIHDDLDLAVGRKKLKLGGGLAGHNGLRSINSHLHTADFSRIRIGIGRPSGQHDVADYVLRRPGKADAEQLAVVLAEVCDLIDQITEVGVEQAIVLANETTG